MSILCKLLAVSGLLFLVACGGSSPFIESDAGTTTDDTDTDDDTTTADPDLPPGTANPRASRDITRFEPTESDGGQMGDGFATDFQYDETEDKHSVDNLAFDGANEYSRVTFDAGADIPTDFRAYQSSGTFTDTFGDTDTDITQFQHRLIYAVSDEGEVHYAIVRTGQYVDYGFGGFTYDRDGSVTLPSTGQAGYAGKYQAIRDFSGRGGLEYATADMTMAIDFDDFNDGEGIQGTVYNRRVFDLDGNDITDEIETALGTTIPELKFALGAGVGTDAGEMVGSVSSNIEADDGSLTDFEDGSFYGILQGADAETVIGVIVSTHEDPRVETGTVTVRETGGFLLERGATVE